MYTSTNISKALYFALTLLLFTGCTESNPVAPESEPIEKKGLATVDGLVTDDENNPYAGVTVGLRKKGSTETLVAVRTIGNGTYSFARIQEGEYDLFYLQPLASEAMGPNPISMTVKPGEDVQHDIKLRLLPVEAYVIGDEVDAINEIRNSTGSAPEHPDELLFHANAPEQLTPVLAPDGHQVTFEEWKQASGNVQISCTGNGTNYALELEGLMPNGAYTVWNILSNQPAVFGGVPDNVGFGSLGPANGSGNVITASDTGEGQLEVLAPAGPMSVFGDMPNCVPTQTPGSALIVLYHIDGNTYGATPGPEATWVGHLMIYLGL